MSWFNTNTVQGRFGLITRAQYLRYRTTTRRGATGRDSGAGHQPGDGRRPSSTRAHAVRQPPVDLAGDAGPR